jgi:hypothetical protein
VEKRGSVEKHFKSVEAWNGTVESVEMFHGI